MVQIAEGTTFDFGAVSGGSYTWNSGTRAIEIQDYISSIDPLETKFLNTLRDVDVGSASPEWYQVSLTAPGANAQEEAETYAYSGENVPARVQNRTQIFRKSVIVSGRAQAENHMKIPDMLKFQVDKAVKEIKRDYEWNALRADATATLAEATATQMRSMIGGTPTTSNTAAIDTGNRTDLTAVGGFDESYFKNTLLKAPWSDGANPTDVFVGETMQDTIDGFTGNSNKYYIANMQNKIHAWVNKYESPFGLVDIHIMRSIYIPADLIFCMDKEYFAKGWLRRTWMEEPPKDGDYWKAVIQGEFCLVDYNGKGASEVINADDPT